jgi:Tol biopolymer transport system component/CubicO group peptidase (beta-lactamase class C family)
MTIRHILFGALAASVALTSVAAAGPAETNIPPPVGRIARELADGGAQRVIVFASVGDKSYVATAGTRHPTAGQRFRVGSVTKTFTATIVLQLVDEGKLALSNTLEDHLPGVVRRGAQITIRQLLQHRSGLVNYTDEPYLSWLKGASRSPSTRPIDLLRFAGSKQLSFEPGSQWSYSNTNYIALGLVIEQVTGSSYAHELDQRILRPIALDDTELPKTRLLPDLGDDGAMTPMPGYPKGHPTYDVDWANPNVSWAAGGIVSNARDVSRFYSALLSGRILSSASLAKMKETVGVGVGVGAGLGIYSESLRCGRSWAHGGGILDYRTLVIASEKGDRAGVVSVYGAVSLSDASPDKSALVCAEFRLAESAATSRIAFIRTPNELSVTNADGTERRKLTGNAALGTPAWSPDGKKIAFVRKFRGDSEVYVMNADSGPQQRLARGSAPAWSPDGQKIAFVRSGEIYVMNADGSGQRNLTRDAASDSDAAWSHDGKKIAFVRERGGNSDVFVMSADGTGQQNLTRNAARDEDPVWSPDGRIAFARKVAWGARGVGGQFEIFVMNADGSGQRRLTRNLSGDFHPAWSPDGRKIVFENRGAAAGGGSSSAWYDVNVVNADGSRQPTGLTNETRPLRNRAPRAALPAWSPDGRMIAFLSWNDDNYDVYVMNADGSGQTNLTRSPADESRFAWSPGRKQRR